MTSHVSHETTPLLQIQQVSKRFGSTIVLDEISLSVTKGQIVSILGRSGSGKSTLLRCVAGLELVDQGRIMVGGQDITHLPTHQRQIGMMFQQFALFPHRTVAENIAFGLKMRGDSQLQQIKRVEELLELVGLQGYGKRSIFELSGGEQQRVALARSLAPNPPLLLLDEPMSSLDQSLRERLMGELRVILNAVQITALYITHDQHEAFAVADWLVLLEGGKIVQQGNPEEVYHQPTNGFAAQFFGLQNILPIEGTPRSLGKEVWEVKTAIGILQIQQSQTPQGFVVIPAESAEIVDKVDNPVDNFANLLTGVVQQRSFRGGYYEVMVDYGGGIVLTWEVEKAPLVNESITVHIPPTKIVVVSS